MTGFRFSTPAKEAIREFKRLAVAVLVARVGAGSHAVVKDPQRTTVDFIHLTPPPAFGKHQATMFLLMPGICSVMW
jgi:hypothetical protein